MLQDVINKLNRLGEHCSPLTANDKDEIESLYTQVLDKKFVRTSCNDCYHDAIIEMICYIKKHGKMKEKCAYKLKNGVLLQMEFGSSDFYVNETLTDEIAEQYLAKHPGSILFFAEYPEDWKERAAKKVEKKKKKSKGKAVELDAQLLGELAEALKIEGATEEDVRASFSEYQLNGEVVTPEALDEYINAAKMQDE
nr:MAG TPA_asm: hypothetical protein [Caudoviricetes sp.]